MAVDHTRDVSNDATDQTDTVKETWEKPEILSHRPAVSAQGIFVNPLDGISNLS